jgi:ABC-type sugar transport system ATPase subunit
LNTSLALRIKGLGKAYHAGVLGCTAHARALDDVSLEMRHGEVVALVGPHGAGKTTLLLCAAGLLTRDAGTIQCACDIDGEPAHTRYFSDPIQVTGMRADERAWDIAFVDNADRVCGDIAAAYALLTASRYAHAHGAVLLLAARDARAVQNVADRIVHIQCGRLESSASISTSKRARVAENRSVDRDSGGA